MNKKAIEFAWIFSIIIGAIVLFLAFYFVGSQIFLKEKTEATERAHSLDILFNPFAYLGAMGAVTAKPIELQKTASLEFDCFAEGLGSNVIMVDSGLPRSVYDKYIFAENFRAKKIQTISKAFSMPWRVADLIFVFPSTKEYCFVRAPQKLKQELELLNITNIKLENSIENCEENATKVCFSRLESCEIKVNGLEADYSKGYVEKQNKKLYFAGDDYALMLGAIFSSKELYDCNVKRIASRLEAQIEVYEEKRRMMAQRCTSMINLERLEQKASRLLANVNEENMNALYDAAKEIENLNSYDCPLF
ncbi:MAG: hypothetical protein QXW65_00095 [Candidatus Pacearchaeota archaeon]